MPGERSNLLSRYCQTNQCRPSRFGGWLFWRCLHRHALPVALLIAPFVKIAFRLEFNAIDDAGRAESVDELAMVANEFSDRCRLDGGFLRRRLYLRLSGKRLMEFGSKYLTKAEAATAPMEIICSASQRQRAVQR